MRDAANKIPRLRLWDAMRKIRRDLPRAPIGRVRGIIARLTWCLRQPLDHARGMRIQYCVANTHGAAPLSSSFALNNATLSFGLALENLGFAAAIENLYLRTGVNVHLGRLTHKAVAASLGLSFSPSKNNWLHRFLRQLHNSPKLEPSDKAARFFRRIKQSAGFKAKHRLTRNFT